MAKVTFNKSNRDFYNELKGSVELYFAQQRINKTGNWKLYIKALTLIPVAVGLYVFLLAFPVTAVMGIVLSGLLGFIIASIGFNVMHDACHGSYSSKKWVNNLLG